MIDKMRRLEIDDHMYDIKKLQRERKYEGQSKIKEIRINGVTHEGTVNVIKAVEEEMKKELKSKDAEDFNALPTEEEKEFLKYIPVYSWTPEEVAELNKKTTATEVMNILETEVDLDSAPGEDSIKYRIIKKLMNNHKQAQLSTD